MKLKTKFQDENFDLGEVVEANVFYGGSGKAKIIAGSAEGGMSTFYFETLKGMNEMFEDYEEPKIAYFINWFGEVSELLDHISDKEIEKLREIGNYFETEEEAEKAVERLKALKKLKDKGMIKYSFHEEKRGIDLDFYTLTILAPRDKDSLDLLFGGEE